MTDPTPEEGRIAEEELGFRIRDGFVESYLDDQWEGMRTSAMSAKLCDLAITERILHNRAKKEIAELRADLERGEERIEGVWLGKVLDLESELASLKEKLAQSERQLELETHTCNAQIEKLEKVEGSLAQIADCLNQELRENNTGHIQVTDYLNSDFRPMIRILVDRVKMYSTPQTGR